jgi:hypothetical protein
MVLLFKRLIHHFRQAKAAAKLTQRQQRFTDIVRDKRFNPLEPVFARVAEQDPTLTDEEILTAYYAFSDRIQTNTFAAAELEWVTVAGLCVYRPHLTALLIRRALLSIIWSIGDDSSSEAVLAFVHQRILADAAMPYGGLPSAAGLTWLKEGLPMQKALIQHV